MSGEYVVAEVVAELQRVTAQRRRNGEYPPGLEEQLEAQFARIMASVHRGEITTSELRVRVHGASLAAARIDAVAPSTSRFALGSRMHALIARLVGRHTRQLADGFQAVTNEMVAALSEVAQLIDQQQSADQRQLRDVVGAVHDRVAVIDHLVSVINVLEDRIQQLEATQGSTS